jgi:YesN/AraC family two-component response regulator
LCQKLPQVTEVKGFIKGLEALEWLNEHTVDVAILDINMPDIDGLTLAARIKEKQPDTAIVFLTGYSQYAVDAFALHASGYLLKPLNPKHLAREIEYVFSLQEKKPSRSHIVVQTFGEFDVLVDGPFIQDWRDTTLPFRGSWNQRIIHLNDYHSYCNILTLK